MKASTGIVPIVLLIFLSACSSDRILVETKQNVVIKPPESFYVCPEVSIPEGDYTQADVSVFITDLYRSNELCRGSLERIQEFLDSADEIVERED